MFIGGYHLIFLPLLSIMIKELKAQFSIFEQSPYLVNRKKRIPTEYSNNFILELFIICFYKIKHMLLQ